MPEQLQKAINLSKRTGDRIIVFNSFKAEEAFVIVPLDDYEKILGSQEEIRALTEDELLDRINRDVALWRNENIEKSEVLPELENNEFARPFSSSLFDFEDESENEEDLYYYEEPMADLNRFYQDDSKKDTENKDRKNNWQIPSGIKEAADEVIEDTPF